VISQTEASSSLVLKCPQWVVLSQLQKPLVSRISLDALQSPECSELIACNRTSDPYRHKYRCCHMLC
jgi:hypothetical protein